MQSISRAEHRRSRRELAKRPQWGTLEEFARSRIQSWLQDVLEEEVTELLGRGKSERRAVVDAPVGYRNGHGKTRRLSMMAGTIEVKRPRVRGLEQRFESRLLPLFVRRTEAVSECYPSFTFTDSRKEISSWRCADCSATVRRSPHRRSSGCGRSGNWNSRHGEAGGWTISKWCTPGPMVCM